MYTVVRLVAVLGAQYIDIKYTLYLWPSNAAAAIAQKLSLTVASVTIRRPSPAPAGPRHVRLERTCLSPAPGADWSLGRRSTAGIFLAVIIQGGE